ncbi:MAG TPA: carboxypeptidase-like regulatory domain-containing protein, partial [Candidatus Limnocylindrales bacterium]|nr:carboxypeptidase-like regulatory domain-containing protein [Candidatus Limnocylindrales bacterium]
MSVVILTLIFASRSYSAPTWNGVLHDAAGKPVADARITLRASAGDRTFESRSSASGTFVFAGIDPGTYTLAVESAGKTWTAAKLIVIAEGSAPNLELTLSAQDQTLGVAVAGQPLGDEKRGTGGEHLSSEAVSGLPLNERDFSKLLLLAAGTMTDSNGAANFTQQFAFNGQRGVDTVFAMDGGTTTDPELGGATFANFNVDAIHEVQSISGVMPAEIGQGAAGFTNVVTKSGSGQLHGSAFEFVRNAAFDARNFFDISNPLDPRRIPPFVRNEF